MEILSRRHLELEIVLIILLVLAVTINAENLDAATDPDSTTDELTIENSAASDHGKLSLTPMTDARETRTK